MEQQHLELSKKDFGNLIFSVPGREEQELIAMVLDFSDREIESLEELRSWQQHQKKGLMQQLLTGKVQVNFEDHKGGK